MVVNDLFETYFDQPMASGSSNLRECLVDAVKYIMATSVPDITEEPRAPYFLGISESFSAFLRYSSQRRTTKCAASRITVCFERTWLEQEIAPAQNVRLVYDDEETGWSAVRDALSPIIETHSSVTQREYGVGE